MNFNVYAKYDPSKYESIREASKEIYKHAPDPTGFEARYDMAEVITAVFPHINKNKAFHYGPKIIEAYTGHKMTPEGFLKEFGKTFASRADSVWTSMRMSSAMMIPDSELRHEELQKIADSIEGKIPYRSDFKHFGLFADLGISSANLLPSMLPFVGLHTAGNILLPGAGGALVTKIAGSALGGMMEAGGLLQELYNMKDEEGNRLSKDLIEAAWLMTMAGTGVINFFTQDFERKFGSAIRGIFNPQAISGLATSGSLGTWAMKRIGTFAKDIGVEAMQEALQEMVGMLSTNYAIRRNNKIHNTNFTEHDYNEIGVVMAQTAIETAKGMLYTGMLKGGLESIVDYRRGDMANYRAANLYTKPTKGSFILNTGNIIVDPDVKVDPNFKGFTKAIDVERAGDMYIPTNKADHAGVASILAKRASHLNVNIVGERSVGTIDMTLSAKQAYNLASKIDGATVVDNVITFEKDIDKARMARIVAEADRTVGFEIKKDGDIVVNLRTDGTDSEIVFTTKKMADSVAPDVKAPVRLEPEVKEAVPKPLRTDLRTLKTDLEARGATQSDVTFLTDTVLNDMSNAIKKRSPRMSMQDVYGEAIPTTYYAFLVSQVAGIDAETFFTQHFNADAFVSMTSEQEAAYFKSTLGKEAIAAYKAVTGEAPKLENLALGGLLQKVDGKWQIALGRAKTPTTLIHELSHVMVDLIKDTDAFKPFLELYAKEVKADGGKVGRTVQERFARDVVLYIQEGKMSDPTTQRIFARITNAMKQFISRYIGQEIDPEVKKEIEHLLGIKLKPEVESTVEAQAEVKSDKAPIQLDLSADEDTFAEMISKIVPDTEVDTDTEFTSIEKIISLQEIKEMLKRGEYPHDSDLDAHAGDPDVDWEIQFRKIHNQDPTMVQVMRDIVNDIDPEIDPDQQTKQILEMLNEMVDKEFKVDVDEEVGNPERFVERFREQLRYKTREEDDAEFVRGLKDRKRVIEVSNIITQGSDLTAESDISQYIYKVANQDHPTDYAIRKAREALRADRTYYRHMYLESIGDTAQITFEQNTYAQTYSGEVSRYQNTEVVKLLQSDIDENIKAMIRKGLATESTLQYVIDQADQDIKQFAKELGIKESQVADLMRMAEQAETELSKSNADLQKVRELNKKNRYHGIKRTLKMRTDALEAKAQYQKLLRLGDRIATPYKNYDAQKMHIMQGFWNIMKTDRGEVRVPLDGLFQKYMVDLDMFPPEFRQFFVIKEDGIYFDTKMNRMSMSDLHYVENLMIEYKKSAKGAVDARTEAMNKATGDTTKNFAINNLKIEADTRKEALEATAKKYAEQKINERRASQSTFKGYMDTNFLTLSRMLRVIDPSGVLSDYFFDPNTGLDFQEYQKFGKLKLRYDAIDTILKDQDITRKDLNQKLTVLPRKGRLGDQNISVAMATAIYIYSQQEQGLHLLTSEKGNAFSRAEVDSIVNMLPHKFKVLGDHLIKDMSSRYKDMADVFYRVENKVLGQVDNYFTLVPADHKMNFREILDNTSDFLARKASDTQTQTRTPAEYALSLELLNNYRRMAERQEHYIASAEWIRDTQYMLRREGGDLYRSIEMTKGLEYAKALQNFVNDFANRATIYDSTDTLVNNVRNNLAVARIGANPITVLKQIPSLAYFAKEFGVGQLLSAMSDVIFDFHNTNKMIEDLAPKMAFRSAYPEVQLLSYAEGRPSYQRVVSDIGRITTYPIRLADKLVVNTLWLGYYRDAISKGIDANIAALNATRFIGDTQVGGTIVDVAAIYRKDDNLMKFLTMFSSQQNKNFNAIWADLPQAFKQQQYKQMIGTTVALGLSFTGILLAGGHLKRTRKETDEEWFERASKLALGQTVQQIPVIGGGLSSIVMGEYYNTDSFPVVPQINRIVRALETKDEKKRAENLGRALFGLGFDVMEVTGLPAGAGKKLYNAFSGDDVDWGHLLNSRWSTLINEW